MKRPSQTFAVFTLAISLLAAYGCGGGSSASTAGTGTGTGTAIIPSPLTGTWKWQSALTVGPTVIQASKTNDTLTFAANGDWILTIPKDAWRPGRPSADCSLTGTSVATATTITQTSNANTCDSPPFVVGIVENTYTISGTTLTMFTPITTDTWVKQ